MVEHDRLAQFRKELWSSGFHNLVWKSQQVFKQLGRYESTMNTAITKQEQIIQYKNIFIDSLRSEKYKLKKPIPINLEHAEAVYIATNYDLELYGYGDSEQEAIEELRNSIIECYEDLKEEDQLGPLPSKMMAYVLVVFMIS